MLASRPILLEVLTLSIAFRRTSNAGMLGEHPNERGKYTAANAAPCLKMRLQFPCQNVEKAATHACHPPTAKHFAKSRSAIVANVKTL